MPNDAQPLFSPTGCEDLAEQIVERLLRDDRFVGAIGEIAITTIDVAERGRLDDQQLYLGHYLRLRFACRPPSEIAGLPVAEPVAPIVPVMPIVPVRPAKTVAPVTPGKSAISLGGIGLRLIECSYSVANSGEPL